MWNSFVLAVLASLAMAVLAFVLVSGKRLFPHRISSLANRVSVLGYALPGSVLAIAIFIPFVWLDRKFSLAISWAFGIDIRLLLTGSLFAVVLGLTVRFHAVIHTALTNGMKRIPSSLDEVCLLAGLSGFGRLRPVYFPLLKSSLATGLLLAFVDSMKEMPLTLMTRPFGWDTLATYIFEVTSEGDWQKAAMPAIFIVMLGLVPIYLLVKQQRVIS
jgi:iron(III) transport system permease protein